MSYSLITRDVKPRVLRQVLNTPIRPKVSLGFPFLGDDIRCQKELGVFSDIEKYIMFERNNEQSLISEQVVKAELPNVEVHKKCGKLAHNFELIKFTRKHGKIDTAFFDFCGFPSLELMTWIKDCVIGNVFSDKCYLVFTHLIKGRSRETPKLYKLPVDMKICRRKDKRGRNQILTATTKVDIVTSTDHIDDINDVDSEVTQRIQKILYYLNNITAQGYDKVVQNHSTVYKEKRSNSIMHVCAFTCSK